MDYLVYRFRANGLNSTHSWENQTITDITEKASTKTTKNAISTQKKQAMKAIARKGYFMLSL